MKFLTLMTAAFVAAAGSAGATVVTVYDGVAAGKNSFDATVAAAGSVVADDIWSGLSWDIPSLDRGAYTVTRNDGSHLFVSDYGSLSGQVISIDPYGSDRGIGAFGSGITFTFDSPVNALGFEVGDWATCCHPSALFMSFDGGAPITLFTAMQDADGLFPSQANPLNSVYEIFVAAFNDSGSFSKVSFWGDGFGEALVAGGGIKYALLDPGTLPPAAVPLPAGGVLLASGLGALALGRRRRAA